MRLIDADLVMSILGKRVSFYAMMPRFAEHQVVQDAMTIVNLSPTIEAEPVRHGRWEVRQVRPAGGLYTDYCSECGEAGRDGMTYCPWCGAKMDGGANDG